MESKSVRVKLSSAKKKQDTIISAPILKARKVEENINLKNQIEKQIDKFKFDDFTKLSADIQTELFNSIKNVFVNLRENANYMNLETFEAKYYGAVLEVVSLAVTGNVAAMDYLCYVYKKGMEGVLPMNLTLAHKWGMLAIANGSKLSVDRMRMFLTPVFEYVENSDLDIELMMKNYDIADGEAIMFVAETFAGLYNPKMGITLLEMAKENPASTDSNFQKFLFDANKKRDEVLPEMMKYLE